MDKSISWCMAVNSLEPAVKHSCASWHASGHRRVQVKAARLVRQIWVSAADCKSKQQWVSATDCKSKQQWASATDCKSKQQWVSTTDCKSKQQKVSTTDCKSKQQWVSTTDCKSKQQWVSTTDCKSKTQHCKANCFVSFFVHANALHANPLGQYQLCVCVCCYMCHCLYVRHYLRQSCVTIYTCHYLYASVCVTYCIFEVQ